VMSCPVTCGRIKREPTVLRLRSKSVIVIIASYSFADWD